MKRKYWCLALLQLFFIYFSLILLHEGVGAVVVNYNLEFISDKWPLPLVQEWIKGLYLINNQSFKNLFFFSSWCWYWWAWNGPGDCSAAVLQTVTGWQERCLSSLHFLSNLHSLTHPFNYPLVTTFLLSTNRARHRRQHFCILYRQ